MGVLRGYKSQELIKGAQAAKGVLSVGGYKSQELVYMQPRGSGEGFLESELVLECVCWC